jgi:ribosome recycling factor
MSVQETIKDFESKATASLDALKQALSRIRTGRANLSVLDPIRVDYYGTKTPLNQVATLSVADPRLITVKPFDKSLLKEIENALRSSPDLGISPQNNGEQILLPIPPLTEERRKEFTKLAKSKGEDAKVAIRNARRDVNEAVKKAEKDGEVPGDDAKKMLDKIQQTTDRQVKAVEDLVAKKEKEILEI